MPELKLDATTSLAQLQAFQQSVGKKDEIRAKTNDDGSPTLYTHSNWKSSLNRLRGLNRDPQKRAEKQQAAYTAVKDFLKDRLGNADTSRALVAKMESRIPLDKATLENAINESEALYRSYSSRFPIGVSLHELRQAFMKFVANPTGRTAFKEFCEKEHASENIEFYEAVEDFNAAVANPDFNVDDLKRKLTEIMNLYVIQSAPNQINLEHEDSKHLVEDNRRIQNDPQVTRDDFGQVFAESRKSIEDLIVKDSWRRFRVSAAFPTAVKGMLKNDYPV